MVRSESGLAKSSKTKWLLSGVRRWREGRAAAAALAE